MPLIAFSFGRFLGGIRSISFGFFASFVVYPPSSVCFPSLMRSLPPSKVNMKSSPLGGTSCLPPCSSNTATQVPRSWLVTVVSELSVRSPPSHATERTGQHSKHIRAIVLSGCFIGHLFHALQDHDSGVLGVEPRRSGHPRPVGGE